MPSRAKKLYVFATSFAATVKLTKRQAMHAGVIRDIEQQRVKKERIADFEMQRALEQEYRRVQQVHDGGSAGAPKSNSG